MSSFERDTDRFHSRDTAHTCGIDHAIIKHQCWRKHEQKNMSKKINKKSATGEKNDVSELISLRALQRSLLDETNCHAEKIS